MDIINDIEDQIFGYYLSFQEIRCYYGKGEDFRLVVSIFLQLWQGQVLKQIGMVKDRDSFVFVIFSW